MALELVIEISKACQPGLLYNKETIDAILPIFLLTMVQDSTL